MLIKKKSSDVKCPYCGSKAKLIHGYDIFGTNSTIKYIYVCSRYPECDSYVSAHEHNRKPMGTLADKNLRRKRIKAHKAFEQIWKDSRIMKKDEAYLWLMAKLNLDKQNSHIGYLDEIMCDSLINHINNLFMNK